jgi:energy-converting hydrogenase Eha subunit C
MIYQRKPMNKGFGLALLSVGGLFIISAFTASDFAAPSISPIVLGSSAIKTISLLFIGAGAVTLGAGVTFNPSEKNQSKH